MPLINKCICKREGFIKFMAGMVLFAALFTVTGFSQSKMVEKIYAVVNGELVTYSELKTAEAQMIRVLQQQFKGQELAQKVQEIKKNLLNNFIEQKMILSVAKEKDYDVENDFEIMKKDIMKQYNLSSLDDLKQALRGQGMDYDQWKEDMKNRRIQDRLVYEEIGSKIKIDNADIMAYYKEHVDDFTLPMEFSLNCIYLTKENTTAEAVKEKQKIIDGQLNADNFEETAKTHSQYPGSENNFFMGTFKEGELDAKIEAQATRLKKGEYSPWLETETGWYIVQLHEKTPKKLQEYKLVREKIERSLRQKEQNIKLAAYVEQLKKESHIKIYEEYK